MNKSILVVDDERTVRELLVSQLEFLLYEARAAAEGGSALALLDQGWEPALILLDIEMPGLSGVDVLKRIKETDNDVQVVMVSGLHDLSTVRECLKLGAYDYLAKPFDLDDLSNTVSRALELRRLLIENRRYREDLERRVAEQTEELRQTRDIALLTLAKLAESRDQETGFHLERIAEYCRLLAQALRRSSYARRVDDEFVEWVFKSSPLHDIGKVGIPDGILRKPGPLTPEETLEMRRHCAIGGDTLRSVLEKYSGPSFLSMAMEIAYHHHEKWDGSGYPRELAGEDIPLAARVVALADAYDAITSERPYKKALSHEEAVARIKIDRGLHFDPVVVDTFLEIETDFDAIRRQMQDQQPSLAAGGQI